MQLIDESFVFLVCYRGITRLSIPSDTLISYGSLASVDLFFLMKLMISSLGSQVYIPRNPRFSAICHLLNAPSAAIFWTQDFLSCSFATHQTACKKMQYLGRYEEFFRIGGRALPFFFTKGAIQGWGRRSLVFGPLVDGQILSRSSSDWRARFWPTGLRS